MLRPTGLAFPLPYPIGSGDQRNGRRGSPQAIERCPPIAGGPQRCGESTHRRAAPLPATAALARGNRPPPDRDAPDRGGPDRPRPDQAELAGMERQHHNSAGG